MTDALSLKLGKPTALRGNPFHGLVKGGQLTLPNAATMPYPQPVGEHWQRGSTALIKHPNAPGITRTPEEQAEDAAAGLQWWDRAILSGNQLYGKELPGWIYIDPNGDRWLVTTTLSTAHLNGGTCSVTLSRFGVLGGAPESYTYSVTVPNMGQATPTISGTTGTRVQRYHSSPTGSAAVFEVAVEFRGSDARWWIWRPVGWVEMTLSGLGSACSAAVIIRKNRAETLGQVGGETQPAEPDSYYLESLPDGTSRVVRDIPANGNNYSTLASHTAITFVYRGYYSGYVVGMLYSEAGILQELTVNGTGLTDFNDPPLVHVGATSFGVNEPVVGTWTSNRSSISTLTITYKLDGAAICSYEYSVSEAISESLVRGVGAGGSPQVTREVSVSSVFSPGGTFSETASIAAENAVIGGSFWNPWFDFSMPGQPGQVPARIRQSPLWFDENDVQGVIDICAMRQSNQVFGVMVWVLPNSGQNYRVRYDPEVATPSGSASLPALTLDQGNRNYYFDQYAYASHCPVTGQTARDAEPVCYV